MKNYIYPAALALMLLSAASCNKIQVTEPQIPDELKEKISFSMSDETLGTKAGFVGNETRIVARFQSDENGTENANSRYTKTVLLAAVDGTNNATSFSTVDYWGDAYRKYWDDAFGRSGYISVYAVAIPNSTATTKLAESKLAGGTAWATEATPNNSIDWDVTYEATQTSTTLAAEDLAYSNNIQSTGVNGRYVWNYEIDDESGNEKGYPGNNGGNDHKPGRLQFTQKAGAQTSDAGHFDKGHLMFKHGLSRLTVVLTPGTGFTADRSAATDFKFNMIKGAVKSGNIQLLNFPVKGTLNIKAGSWTTADDGTQNILQMIGAASTTTVANQAAAYNATEATYLANRTYSAQMLPGKVFNVNGAANVMQFTIDDNTYYITEKMVYDALLASSWYTSASAEARTAAGFAAGTKVTMEQGHNYTLTITVNKTGIADVTATLAAWVDVAGATSVNNAHITLSLNTTGATCDKDIDLYRLGDDNPDYDANQYNFTYQGKNWFGNYLTDGMHKTTLLHSNMNETNKNWETSWYFENNRTYYHFRTVNKGTTIVANDTEAPDYFEIADGPVATTDPHWGAPMKTTTTTWLKYDDNATLANYADDKGYEAHLHHAIGATESQIAIQELHMMSNIVVVLKTPNDGGKVQLYKEAVLYTADDLVEIEGVTYVKESVNMEDSEHPALYNDSNSEHDIQKNVGAVKEDPVGTIVKITRLSKTGKVEMGRGVVTPTGEFTGEETMTSPSITSAADYFTDEGVTNGTISKNYTFAIVPQALSRNESSESDADFVGIFIQTPDYNQYYVVKDLSKIIASSVDDQRNQVKDAAIKRWYPGHKYTYTFTISKTKIEDITATVADWVNVEGQDIPVNLEN